MSMPCKPKTAQQNVLTGSCRASAAMSLTQTAHMASASASWSNMLEFMAAYCNEHGFPARRLTALNDADRTAARRQLAEGSIRFIFVVDLYNEGVDIPEIDTILFLRPTESLTIFLQQQLGRGLRLAEGKDCLTVLDFIGQANQNYRFEEKFTALLSNTSREITGEILSTVSRQSLTAATSSSRKKPARQFWPI